LHEQREAIEVWLASEEESFGRTLEQGLKDLGELIERARERGGAVSGADAFQLHDTFGFPIDLTRDLVSEAGLRVDDANFDELMADQRRRSRAAESGEVEGPGGREQASAFVGE